MLSSLVNKNKERLYEAIIYHRYTKLQKKTKGKISHSFNSREKNRIVYLLTVLYWNGKKRRAAWKNDRKGEYRRCGMWVKKPHLVTTLYSRFL